MNNNIEKYLDLYKNNNIFNYILLFSYFLFVSLWYSCIGYAYLEFYEYKVFNALDFSFFFLVSSLFIYVSSNLVYYLYLQDKNKIMSLLSAKKIIESDKDDVSDLLLRLKELSLLYNVDVPDLFIIESENINIGLVNTLNGHAVIITDKMLSRANQEELDFILSCQLVRILSKNCKSLTEMSCDLFLITSSYSFGNWLMNTSINKDEKGCLKYVFSKLKYICGIFVQLIFIPSVLLIKEQERIKLRESCYTFKQVSFVTGIPIGLKGFIRSINEHNNTNKMNSWSVGSFSSLFDFNTGSGNVLDLDFIDAIEDDANLKSVDVFKIDNLILKELSTIKGCISLYYSILMPKIEPPVNLRYKNKIRKIEFDSLMLPYIVRAITKRLSGNIKQKTINSLKCDLILVSSYTNKLSFENIMSCNEIINNLYGIRASYNYGVTSVYDIVSQESIDSEFLLDTINHIKLNENLKKTCVLEIVSKTNNNIDIKTLMVLYSFGCYIPMSFVDK